MRLATPILVTVVLITVVAMRGVTGLGGHRRDSSPFYVVLAVLDLSCNILERYGLDAHTW